MAVPLASHYRESALWQEQCPAPAISPPPLPARADVVVVGGGYCGLAAAAELAGRGRHTVLIDRERLGWGASTRNGGMVIPELTAGPLALEQAYGPLGRRLHQAVHDAFDWVEHLVTGGSIECDYSRSGQLYLAHHPKVARALAAGAGQARPGEDVRYVPVDELGAEIGSNSFHGALLIGRTGGLHPARFHRGLVLRAEAAGAELHPATHATSIEPRTGGGWRVTTSRGGVDSGDVIAATNAYADGLLPALRRRVLPVGSFIIATEPLAADVAADVSPHGRMFVDTKNFLCYWRLSPDRRLVFGGRRGLGRVTVPEARDHLYRSMVRIHPQLSGVRITHAWGGSVAITVDRMPHAGRIGGVWYATGCNGSGVALHPWLGARIAAATCGEEPPPFTELRHRPVPLHSLRRAWLPAVGAWFRWRDRHP